MDAVVATEVVKTKNTVNAMDEANEALALELCLAVRQNDLEAAQAAFEKILAVPEDAAFAALLKLAILAALRREQGLVAVAWLEASKERLSKLFANEELAKAVAELLEGWCFASCDHRLTNVRVTIRYLVRQWFKAVGARAEAEALEKELLSMAARMVRRGWREEARWLLRLVAWRALHYDSLSQWQGLLAQLGLHFTVYARWESFPKACDEYYELVLLLVVLLRRAMRDAQLGERPQGGEHANACTARKPWSQQQRAAAFKLALRSVRDLITNIARSTMQEDADIFRQWYQYLWQLAGEDAARKQQLMLLLQLSIRYWQRTLPKSSKKQVRFLQDLLQPNLIGEECEALLQSIV